MTTLFQELVAKERAAEQAHRRVDELRGMYGPPTQQARWSARQAETYNTALRAWRDLAREVQVALADYARESGDSRADVEKRVREAALRGEGGGAEG